MGSFKSSNVELGKIDIPKGENIVINTSTYKDIGENINYNPNESNTGSIDNVDFDNLFAESDVMMIYHGVATKKEYVDAAKEEVEQIKKEAAMLAGDSGDKIDTDKIVDDMGIEVFLVNYMIENGTTEISEELLTIIRLKVLQKITTLSQTGDIAIPEAPESHGEVTEAEIEKLKKLLESGTLPEDQAEQVRKIIEEYENNNHND